MTKTNALIHETSPYLKQHAHNPVDWLPWGEEAFRRAREENKPIFLSIGYSTCHWCHVMAHESFESEEIADVLNEHFISIKVDREERPDVDAFYMRACQTMTGRGGWPLSILMTADKKPFWAGTYLRPANFKHFLGEISKLWKSNSRELSSAAEELTELLSQMPKAPRSFGQAPIEKGVDALRDSFDSVFGGFGDEPKFPCPQNLLLLLSTDAPLAETTLDAMYRGGIFDHIGGGFCRYSTDRFWLVPHFEKMLYDNALLAYTYAVAYEQTGKRKYADITERIFTYLEREMQDKHGAFYAAQDADSPHGEGAFYTFTPEERTELLGEEDGRRFCDAYNIVKGGHLDGKSIPNLIGKDAPVDMDTLRKKVYDYRKERMHLETDRKILLGWNALAVSAYAAAGRILSREDYIRTAERTMAHLTESLSDGTLLYAGRMADHRYSAAYLDDYAYVIFALLALHQATQNSDYLTRAAELMHRALDDFGDAEEGGFYFSGKENEQLPTRLKEAVDGAMPSGNSVMHYNLSRLSLLTGDERFRHEQTKQRAYMNGEAGTYPAGFSFYLYSALPVRKIVCATPEGDSPDVRIRTDWAFRYTDDSDYPIKNDLPTYYVCEDEICLPPTNEL